jgi:hypothetical protein
MGDDDSASQGRRLFFYKGTPRRNVEHRGAVRLAFGDFPLGCAPRVEASCCFSISFLSGEKVRSLPEYEVFPVSVCLTRVDVRQYSPDGPFGDPRRKAMIVRSA